MADRATWRYRRRVRLAARGPVAVGALEDDIHHVRVAVRHDGTGVVAVTGEAVRLPWSTCPGSEAGIASLVGTPLARATRGLRDAYRRELHCTHMFDLAQLVLAHAARGLAEGEDVGNRDDVGAGAAARDYLATVTPVGDAGAVHAEITMNGVTQLVWDLTAGELPDVGDSDTAEAAFVLRRAVYLAPISSMHFDTYDTVGQTGLPVGSCWTAQPERIAVAFRHRGSQHHYADTPELMTAGFEDFRDRAFAD